MKGAFVDIRDTGELASLLSKLGPGTIPHWGKLDAQSMVEHIAEALEYTNGEKFAALEVSEEEALIRKQNTVHPDLVLPMNIKGPLGDATGRRRCKDLSSAISEFMRKIAVFHQYYSVPGRSAIHPSFGALDHEEWLMWHGKHFAHHFKQFGLIDCED